MELVRFPPCAGFDIRNINGGHYGRLSGVPDAPASRESVQNR